LVVIVQLDIQFAYFMVNVQLIKHIKHLVFEF